MANTSAWSKQEIPGQFWPIGSSWKLKCIYRNHLDEPADGLAELNSGFRIDFGNLTQSPLTPRKSALPDAREPCNVSECFLYFMWHAQPPCKIPVATPPHLVIRNTDLSTPKQSSHRLRSLSALEWRPQTYKKKHAAYTSCSWIGIPKTICILHIHIIGIDDYMYIHRHIADCGADFCRECIRQRSPWGDSHKKTYFCRLCLCDDWIGEGHDCHVSDNLDSKT